MKRKNYLPPETTVCGVELESPICSGSVISPEADQKLTIEKQQFNQSWDSGADFSTQTEGWTPNTNS